MTRKVDPEVIADARHVHGQVHDAAADAVANWQR